MSIRGNLKKGKGKSKGKDNDNGNEKRKEKRKRKRKGKRKETQLTKSDNIPSATISQSRSISGDSLSEDSQNPSSQSRITTSAVNSNDEANQPTIEVEKDTDKLLNFHIGIHFERINNEIGVVWNGNVLWGENKHRFFKQAVLAKNHQKPERQLLTKECLLSTVKALMNESFLCTSMKITA